MPEAQPADTVFGDLGAALAEARQARRVPLTPAVTGLQLCYYAGIEAPPPDAPRNLVHVPLEQFPAYFASARTRAPKAVVPPSSASVAERRAFATAVNQRLHGGQAERQRLTLKAIERYRQRPRRPPEGGRLRVFAASSRETTVMQYASLGLIRAFERLGHETRFVIEADDTQRLDLRAIVEELEAFDPHVVLNVNHQNNAFIPPDVANAIWWQDLMPPLAAGKPLAWRPNDLVYAALSNDLAPAVAATGLPSERLRIQPFCIDTSLFHSDGGDSREDKIVFVGSSASIRLKGYPGEARLVEQLEELVRDGTLLTETQVRGLGVLHGVPPDHAFHSVYYYVMRDRLVRWLCRVPGLRVEVYGRYWDRDPEVAPFYKGELPHGPAVADVYRSAKYALVVHPLSINTQRFAEAVACGCIPVQYDCRPFADPPHWDDRVLYFRTPQELAAQFGRTVPVHAAEFADFFSYDRFARRILADAAPFLTSGA
jgi:hypothetical protein